MSKDNTDNSAHRLSLREFDFQVRSNRTLIYICTHEEARVQEHLLQDVCSRDDHKWSLFTWDIAAGLASKDPEFTNLPSNPMLDQMAVLKWFSKQEPEAHGRFQILILKDFHKFLGEAGVGQMEIEVIRSLRNLVQECRGKQKSVVILGTKFYLPAELEKVSAVIDWPLPEKRHINAKVSSLLKAVGNTKPELANRFRLQYNQEEMDEVVQAFQGLTLTEIELLCTYTMLTHDHMDPAKLSTKKKDIIRKSGLVEWIDIHENMETVGGLHGLKHWLKKRRNAFSQEALEYGLPANPKGVLLVGIQGGGKSLSAQAIAHFWKLPLLRLDMGKVFSGIVGSSEENIRAVIKVAESIAPCVTGETVISLSDGSKKTIKDIYESHEGNLDVLSVDEEYNLCSNRVNAVTRRVVASTIRIDTFYGKIETTAEHLHPIIRDGKMIWVTAGDLLVGDYIAKPKTESNVRRDESIYNYIPDTARLYFDGALKSINSVPTASRRFKRKKGIEYAYKNELSQCPNWAGVNKIAIGPGGTAASSLSKTPSHVNENLGYILGLIESDGYLGQRTISLINTHPALHYCFACILKADWGLNVYFYRNKQSGIPNLSGLSDSPEFKACFVSKADNLLATKIFKNVESNLLIQSKDFLRSWVKGVFDGDGFVSADGADPKITITAKTKRGNDLIRIVMEKVGFTTHNGDCHNIEITGIERVKKFAKEIGSCHPDKIERLSHWSNFDGPGKDRSDVIPLGLLLKQAMQSLGMSTTDFRYTTPSLVSYYTRSLVHPNRLRVKSLVSEMDKWAAEHSCTTLESLLEIKKLLDAQILWSKVLNKEEVNAEIEVYDLCTDNGNFIANGLLTHNCILWIDEIEKGLSGVGSSDRTDGGTASRVFGSILTWMQEKSAPVAVVATANNVHQLPAELLRKGRFDEIFFVDLPSDKDREEIFKIHLNKRQRKPEEFDTKNLALLSDGYTGAEIEAAVIAALYEAYDDNKRPVTTLDISEALQEMVPLSVTMSEQINSLRTWAKNRARSASTCKIARESQKETQVEKNAGAHVDEEEEL